MGAGQRQGALSQGCRLPAQKMSRRCWERSGNIIEHVSTEERKNFKKQKFKADFFILRSEVSYHILWKEKIASMWYLISVHNICPCSRHFSNPFSHSSHFAARLSLLPVKLRSVGYCVLTEDSPPEFSNPRHLSGNLGPICCVVACSKGLETLLLQTLSWREQPILWKLSRFFFSFSFKKKNA